MLRRALCDDDSPCSGRLQPFCLALVVSSPLNFFFPVTCSALDFHLRPLSFLPSSLLFRPMIRSLTNFPFPTRQYSDRDDLFRESISLRNYFFTGVLGNSGIHSCSIHNNRHEIPPWDALHLFVYWTVPRLRRLPWRQVSTGNCCRLQSERPRSLSCKFRTQFGG